MVCDSNYVYVGFISLTGNAPSPIDGVNGSLTRPAGDCYVGTLKAAAVADATPISSMHRGPRAMRVASASEYRTQEASSNLNLRRHGDTDTCACLEIF